MNPRSLIPIFFISLLPLAQSDVQVPADMDHSSFDILLRKYVDDKGLVDYAAWKDSAKDLEALERYLSLFANPPEPPAKGDDRVASLINAYNAFTLQLILEHYPTESIRLLDRPFDGRHFTAGGEKVSVDQIEHKTLRPLIGWKIHSVVVCAARSCPPLLNRAYTADTWEERMRERYRAWLAREDLNSYDPDHGRRNRGQVEISKIFDWYSEDFTGENTVEAVLGRFGPEKIRAFLKKGGYRIRYAPYHWGLNDQGGTGKDYSHNILRSIF